MTPCITLRAAEKLKGMNKYTQRILLSFFLRNVAHGKSPQELGRPLNEDGTLRQYRIGSCRLICCLEKERAVLLAVTEGLPERHNKLKTKS